eukprot:1994308-Rhodomonas_salina.1
MAVSQHRHCHLQRPRAAQTRCHAHATRDLHQLQLRPRSLRTPVPVATDSLRDQRVSDFEREARGENVRVPARGRAERQVRADAWDGQLQLCRAVRQQGQVEACAELGQHARSQRERRIGRAACVRLAADHEPRSV